MKTFKLLIKSFRTHDILGMSAKSAYYLLFAFFPLMAIILITLNGITEPALDATIPDFAMEMAESTTIPHASLLILLIPVARGIYELKLGLRKIYQRKIRLREAYFGTILTIIAWLIVTKGFELYMRHFNNFTALYGQIGTFLGLALWLYVMSLTLFLSAAINALRLQTPPQTSLQA